MNKNRIQFMSLLNFWFFFEQYLEKNKIMIEIYEEFDYKSKNFIFFYFIDQFSNSLIIILPLNMQ